MESMLDRREDRCGVVLGAIDHEVATKPRGNDQCRDPGSWTPDIVRSGGCALARRRNVVPLAAELVIGHDHHGVFAAGATLDGLDEVNQVIAAGGLTRVTGVLVLQTDRLDKADGL